MSGSDDFKEFSYRRHEAEYSEYTAGGSKAERAKAWARDDTVDAWRHRRMYRALDPLVQAFPNATWVTIGDGRFANDAHYLHSSGASVLATDISDALLKEAVTAGYIPAFEKQNAEDLSFSDASFDFVFCKESFHHFPRPMLALYEMLRVSRNGVVLIEPNDQFVAEGLFEAAGSWLFRQRRRLLGRPVPRHQYEPSGNYEYVLSRREIEKVGLGLNFPVVAFKGLNDRYLPGVEDSKADRQDPLFQTVKRRVAILDFLSRIGLFKTTHLVAVIFKSPLDTATRGYLKRARYDIVDLPDNPYRVAS